MSTGGFFSALEMLDHCCTGTALRLKQTTILPLHQGSIDRKRERSLRYRLASWCLQFMQISPTQYAVPIGSSYTSTGANIRTARRIGAHTGYCGSHLFQARTTTQYRHTSGEHVLCAVLGQDPLVPSLLQIMTTAAILTVVTPSPVHEPTSLWPCPMKFVSPQK